MRFAGAVVLACLLTASAEAQPVVCVAGAPACTVPAGTYHVALPAHGSAHPPAVMFLHGLGGSGEGVLANRTMTDALTARGFAVIAPDGLPSPRRQGLRWSFRFGTAAPRDDRAFLLSVRDDAATRFGIDPARIALGGFSNGAFLVTYVACAAPGSFAAYLPVAGGFWRPHPEACAGPVALFTTEGWSDATVPIEGRPLRNGEFYQGDIFATMAIFREASGCSQMRPDIVSTTGAFWRRSWTSCAVGSALELALHPGGHAIPDGWAPMVADWLDTLPPWLSASAESARERP